MNKLAMIGGLLLASVFMGCDDNGPEPEMSCPGGIIGDLDQPPEIKIVGLKLGDGNVQGVANNVDASVIRAALWAKTDLWYVQPLISHPYTNICSDGSWENWTHPWSRMVALLVDESYDPGATRLYHPSGDPGVLAWDEYPVVSPDRMVDFSGYEWRVKVAEGYQAGPGPNYFSGSEEDVWIDQEGLHLTIRKRDGKWYSTEIVADHSFGYGEYTFQISTRVDNLDYKAVFAGFVYESLSREIDIEFSRLLADPDNAQYVIQPWTREGNITRFTMPSMESTSHRFSWSEDDVSFVSWSGHAEEPAPEDILQMWTYTGPDIPPPGGERMRFNFWLFGGDPPSGGHEQEAVVKSFSFRPLP